MIKSWFNYKNFIAFAAIFIVIATIVYTSHISKKIALQEKKNIEVWVASLKTILNSTDSTSLNLASKISTENNTIPIIETNEKDSLTGVYINLDSSLVASNKHYLQDKLNEFKAYQQPIVLEIQQQPYIANKYYYGPSVLLKEVKYYPIVQMIVVFLFIVTLLLLMQSNYKSTQNQIWAGLAKETAHQLGTPVTSLEGWVEILKDQPSTQNYALEIEKDVNRLQLISDRFGKIGSTPQLENKDVVEQINKGIDYMKKRSGNNVSFICNTKVPNVFVKISPPLFDWVIENLLKNALDAMEGKGKIEVNIFDAQNVVAIEFLDNGKGIAKANIDKVFSPGFTTKKRGWGLGLTLTKRIVEQYHNGTIFVKNSELGKGTTFRIELKK
jgi:signal transduction histidine kinase